MDPDSSKSLHIAPLLELASALEDIRDAFMLISLALKDVLAEMPSQARDDVETEVDSFLNRIRANSRDSYD